MTSVYDFNATTIDGAEQSLSDFSGTVLIIVNVASRCGFTPQYEGLEALYQKYKNDGLNILGFPCNQFGAQEPGDERAIAEFCSTTYDVSFPMFSKIDVNGANTHSLFGYLKRAKPGFAGSTSIKWNFTKFLTDRKGQAIRRFSSRDTPASMERAVETQLNS